MIKIIRKTIFAFEYTVGDLYFLSTFFGLLKFKAVADVRICTFFGLPVFKAVGDMSCFMGVDWNGF